jgi:hypothetical protein
MRRKIKIALLTLGMIGGFSSGIASLKCRAQGRREAFEQHVARVCVDAARAAGPEAQKAPTAKPAD